MIITRQKFLFIPVKINIQQKVIFDTRFKYNDDNCSVFINSANCFELLLRYQLYLFLNFQVLMLFS